MVIGEPIYEKSANVNSLVQVGDIRKTNWGTLFSYYLNSNPVTGFCQPGDGLILSEVLKGGCESATYNLSVETDFWEGEIPGKTYAALRSPNGDFTFQAQDVQKATVLDPTGVDFNVPACTFENLKLNYREYLGVEIWHDNGVDNNLGADPTGVHQTIPNNASDDYYPDITGELFIGAQSNESDADIGLGYDGFIGRPTYQQVLAMSDFFQQDRNFNTFGFGAPVRFCDTTNIGGYGRVNIYGCSETLYRDTDYLLPATAVGLGAFEISQGDIRLSRATTVRTDAATGSQTIQEFEAGTTVAVGDADVNRNPGLGPVDAYNGGIAAGNDLSAFYCKYFDQLYYNAYVNTWTIPYEPVWLDWKHLDPASNENTIEMNFRYDIGEFIYDAGANIVIRIW